MNSTIVTGFFNLSRFENNNRHNRGPKYYMEKGKELLRRDIQLVIFTEADYVKDIEQLRAQHLDKTKIITLNIANLPYFKYLEKIKENLEIHPIKNKCPIKDTPGYLVLQMNKLYFLSEVINTNPFGSSHFGWIDFGISHVANFNYVDSDDIFNKIPNKVSLLQLRNYESALSDIDGYLSFIRGISAAGFICGDSNHLTWFIQSCEKKYKEIINSGYAASEEMLFPLIFKGNEDKFRFYYGDYKDILSNFVYQRTNIAHISKMITWAIDEECYVSAFKFGHSLLNSYDNGTLLAEDEQVANVMYLTYISAYKIDSIIAEFLLHKYIALVKLKDGFRLHYNKNKSTILYHFKQLINDVESLLC